MRILAIGDLHFKGSSLGLLSVFEKELHNHLKDNQYDAIVLLGDTLDRNSTIHTTYLNAALSFLEKLSLTGIEIFLIIGNHDLESNRVYCEPKHGFNALKQWPRMHVIDRPTQHGQLLLIPYVPNGRFMEAVGELSPDTKIVFCHQEFKGASFGGHESASPDEWPKTHPMLVSGHIHTRSKLQKNLIYTGSPIQQSFSEDPGNIIVAIEISDVVKMKTISLPNIPKLITYECSISELDTKTFEAPNLYRVKLTTTTPEWAAFRKTAKHQELLKLGVKIVPVIETSTNQAIVSNNKRSYVGRLGDAVKEINSEDLQKSFDDIILDVEEQS